MQTFNLRDEWTSLETEQALVAAIARNPALYWELIDLLPAGVFACEPDAWERVARAIEAEEKPEDRVFCYGDREFGLFFHCSKCVVRAQNPGRQVSPTIA